ncbi:TonB-dependent receptor [Labilibacter sediminis]|nr:TonB-dependent receptor [Labilibacter sediminis]
MKNLNNKTFVLIVVLQVTIMLMSIINIGPSGKASNLFQDERTISGLVVDEDGLPIPGVSIVGKGTSLGTISDIDGKYNLVISSEIEVVVFSFIGMKTQEVQVFGRSTFNITMSPELTGLDEVVVVGYGAQKKANLTGSVSAVDSEQLENRGVANVESALSGQLPGVTILQRGGSPGRENTNIRIRGMGSIGADAKTNPLIIVDGIETGSLSDINANDIESISVLKDAASASIYGVRAANGVILVTTKRGQEGELKVSYSGQIGLSEATRLPEKANAFELATLYNEALVNEGSPKRFSRAELEKFKVGNTDAYANTDHIGEIFSKVGLRHLHNLNFSGGSKDTRYNIGLGYINDGGLIANTGYDRYNVRVNLDHKVSDRLGFGLNLSGSVSEVKDPALGVAWVVHTGYREWATDALKFSDGRWAYPTHAENQGHNSLAYAEDLGNKQTRDTRISGTMFAEYKLLEGLKVKGLVSNIRDFNKSATWVKGVDLYNIDPATGIINDIPNESHFGVSSNVGREFFEHSDLNIDLLLNYERTLGTHFVKGLIGYNQRKIDKEWNSLSRRNLIHPDLDQINAADPSDDNTSGYVVNTRSRSAFARVNYSFDDRYLIEANIRYDGSSRFPKSKELRFEYFPSVSVGWRISEEDFFKSSYISNLKVRGSWGQLGNQEIGDYAYFSTLETGHDYVLNNQISSGIAETAQAPNTTIRWETSESINLGLDAGFFNQKLNIVAEYFIKDTKDILGQVTLPGVFGASEPVTNQLAVKNSGFEIQVGYHNKKGELDYNITANFSKINNEITDLAGTDSPGRRVGDPIANIYGYVSDGLFQNQAEVNNSPDQSALGGVTQPGDIRYKDINGRDEDGNLTGKPDGVINSDDRTNLGSFFPGINYGLSLGAAWKGFDFSMLWQGVADVEALIGGRQQQPFVLGASPWKVHLDRAEIKNGEVESPGAKYPRTTFGNANNYVNSSFWTKSTAFLKLRNAQIGYNLPESFIGKMNLSKARIYISGENLLTLTSFEGFDPETPTTGDPLSLGSTSGYPPVRTYLVGINVTF